MTAPTINFIAEMVPSRPTSAEVAGFGEQWLSEIQRGCQGSFPNLGTAAVTPTAGQLNGMLNYDSANGSVEDRIAYLESLVLFNSAPSNAYDFTDNWWNSDSQTTPGRLFKFSDRRDAYSNVPWEWGSNMTPGTEGQVVFVIGELFRSTQASGPTLQRLTVSVDGTRTGMFWRASDNQSSVTSKPWHRGTFAEVASGDGTGGDVVYTTVCEEQAICP